MARPTLELSMIVRNGGATLDRCLSSVAPLVDWIVVGDTGSTDDTQTLARSYGAEMMVVRWQDDFAAARNEVLEQARCDWILVLDADEMLDLDAARDLLPAMLEDKQVHAYGLWRWNYVRELHGERISTQVRPNPGGLGAAQTYPGYVPSYHVRLFRRGLGICFEHCVHEHVTDRVDALGLNRVTAPLVIHHFAYAEDSVPVFREKVELYQRLLLRKLAGDPWDFDTLFQLGISEVEHLKVAGQALVRFEAAAAARPSDGRAPLYAGICLLRVGRLEEATGSLLRAEALGEGSQVLYDALGDSYLRAGDDLSARVAYEHTYDFGIVSPLTEAKHGTAEVLLGEIDAGLARIRAAIARDPEAPKLQVLLAVSEDAARSTEPSSK
jgi:tetratricopeptide (TPR) repeat protein